MTRCVIFFCGGDDNGLVLDEFVDPRTFFWIDGICRFYREDCRSDRSLDRLSQDEGRSVT